MRTHCAVWVSGQEVGTGNMASAGTCLAPAKYMLPVLAPGIEGLGRGQVSVRGIDGNDSAFLL